MNYQAEPLNNKDELLKWMHDRSETDAVLDEEYRWRYIRQTCDTENEVDNQNRTKILFKRSCQIG
jgi:oligoendopeptidase F